MESKLAREFSRLLREELPEEDFKQLQKLEKRRSLEGIDTNICHSHDFCDANAVMLEAFENVAGREPQVHTGSKDIETMMEAWWEAQSKIFGI